jgi:hypothetical protein
MVESTGVAFILLDRGRRVYDDSRPTEAVGEEDVVYQWLVFAHLVGLVVFAMCHGVSIFSAFRIRGLRDTAAVRDQLALASQSSRVMYIGLLLLAIGGIGAASSANYWGAAWITWSIVVFIAVIIAMYAVAAGYYYPLRDLVNGKDGVAPVEGEALAKALDTRRPELLMAIGGGGLLILIWLMVLKPA